MKKAFVSVVLSLSLLLSLQSVAFAGGGTIKTDSKPTPYGTMNCEIGRSPGGDTEYEWFYAETSINSSYTMAETVAKLDVRDNDTGVLLDSQSNKEINGNSVVCGADGARAPYRTYALFSTHEVTYTSSYVLYMSATY